MPLTGTQRRVADTIYTLGLKHGLAPARAKELVAAAYAESGLNPGAVNSSSGAAGLFQLLSSGYRARAKTLGGVTDPRANTLAILPDYASYWHQHPRALPGEAARDVERSGMGAGFYSAPLSKVGTLEAPLPTPAAGSAVPPPLPAATPQRVSQRVPDGQGESPLSAWAIRQLGASLGIPAGIAGQITPAPLTPSATKEIPLPHPAGIQRPPAARTIDQAGHVRVQVDHDEPAAPLATGVITLAKQYLGTPYTWGGEKPQTGFDCSGFVQWLYAQRGIRLPRTTYDQVNTGRAVRPDALKPGDLLFFDTEAARGPDHEALYIGGGQFIHSPHTGDVIKISSLSDPYYQARFFTARRVA